MTGQMKEIKIVTVVFNIPVRNEELPLFRGAINKAINSSNDFFHNHNENGVIYRYPLIHYKKISGKAALVCLEFGTEALYDFFSQTDWSLTIGERKEELRVDRIKASHFQTGVFDERYFYRMTSWLPLNQENYQRYHQSVHLAEKMEILEKVLTGNILTFLEGIGLRSDRTVDAAISRIDREKVLKYRGQLMQSYDISFSSNVAIPVYTSLGKGTSVGFGMVYPEKAEHKVPKPAKPKPDRSY